MKTLLRKSKNGGIMARIEGKVQREMNYFVRFTETPEQDIAHPLSFYAVSEDKEYLAMLDPDAEIVEAGSGMWGIPTAEEGLCCYGPFETIEEAREAARDLYDPFGGEAWLDLPAVIFLGEGVGKNDIGNDLFIPQKIIEVIKFHPETKRTRRNNHDSKRI